MSKDLKDDQITYEEFARVDLRCGTIIEVKEFPRSKKPAFKVWADFGKEIGVLQTSAQITTHYSCESLIGRQIVGCVKLGEKNIAAFISQFLLCGFADDKGEVCLATVERQVPNGQKMF